MLRLLVFCFLALIAPLSSLAQSVRNVAVEPLGTLASYPLRSAPAAVISLNQPEVSAEISARLESLAVRVGDRVTAGTTLAVLDCSNLLLNRQSAEAQLQSANARLQLARSRLDRAESLIANQLLSQDDLDSRQTELRSIQADQQSAEAQLALAELQTDRCQIRAPFDALVLARLAQVGQWLSPGVPVVSLLDLGRVEVSAQIFATDAERLQPGMTFELEANGRRYPLVLRTLVDAIDPTTRNREARFEFSGEPSLIGAAGKVVWQDARPHLPAELLIERNGALGFFVVRSGHAAFVAAPDAQPGRNNPVALPLETLVVVEGHLGLSDGDPVNSSNP